MSNCMKISSVGAELFHAEGQTDTTKLIVAFRNYANATNTFKQFSIKEHVTWSTAFTEE